jgi:hypothetical protein
VPIQQPQVSELKIPPKTPHLALVPKQLAIIIVPSTTTPQSKTLFKLAARTWIHNTAHLNVSFLLPLANNVAHVPSPFIKLPLSNYDREDPKASILLSAVDTLAKDYAESFDWIMRVQESTFVRVDKLLTALSQTHLNPMEAHLIGHVHVAASTVKAHYRQPACQVLPGYLWSRGLLKTLTQPCATMAMNYKNVDSRLFECMRQQAPDEFVGCRALTNHTRWTRFLSPLSSNDWTNIEDAWYVVKNQDTLHGGSFGNALTLSGMTKDMYTKVEDYYGIHGKFQDVSGIAGRQSST